MLVWDRDYRINGTQELIRMDRPDWDDAWDEWRAAGSRIDDDGEPYIPDEDEVFYSSWDALDIEFAVSDRLEGTLE